jgi:DNA N-6-adenine-methyltransferase (Dam)
MAGEAFAYETPTGENKTDDWLTPPELIEAAGPFDLDPCAYRSQPWRTAKIQYSLPEENGLLLDWQGCVFCNPQYGNAVTQWASRLALHNNGLLLVFARTETQAFRPVWRWSTAILFFYSRLTFHRPDGSLPETGGGAPSVLAAFGKENIARLERAKKWRDGAIVTEWQR